MASVSAVGEWVAPRQTTQQMKPTHAALKASHEQRSYTTKKTTHLRKTSNSKSSTTINGLLSLTLKPA